MAYRIKFIKKDFNRYIYKINDIEVDFIQEMTEDEVKKKIDYVNKHLKSFTCFVCDKLNMPLRDFLLIGYLFFKDDLSEYLITYIEKLIIHNGRKSVSIISILKYIFNERIGAIEYSIHESTDKSAQGYNKKINQFLNVQHLKTKIEVTKKLFKSRDINAIKLIVYQFGIKDFINICANNALIESIKYFKFIIRSIMIPNNSTLTIHYVFSTGTGISKRQSNDSKNNMKSKKRDNFYKKMQELIDDNKPKLILNIKELEALNHIENTLKNFNKLDNEELRKLSNSRILLICLMKYEEKFKVYIEHFCDELINENIIISRVSLIMKIFSNVNNVQANHIYTYYKMNNDNMMLEDLMIKKMKVQVKKLANKLIMIGDEWIIYIKSKDNLKKYTINYSAINKSIIKHELKKFYEFIIYKELKYRNENDGISKIITDSTMVINCVRYLQINLGIRSTNDIQLIHVHKLLKYLKNDYKTKYNKSIKTSTIVHCVTTFKTWFNWLIESETSDNKKPNINPFEYVTIKGVSNENTEVIPECVIEQLLIHLQELDSDIQRMALIMLNGGMRFKEVKLLEFDCIMESNDEYKILKYIPYKVLNARRKHGLDDYHRIIIDEELYKEVQEQIFYTKDLREKYFSKEIFLRVGINDNLSLISSNVFCIAVQKLIDKYNITDSNGEVWKISSRQYRKTLAVDMITLGGATERDVTNYLGHLDYATTSKYYNEVRKKKLADMNSTFFKKKFKLLIGNEELEKFSDEERKLLYVDFCLNSREVEYGVCMKHFSIEPCNKRADIFACATCSKLCTGKKYLERWNSLYIKQKDRVDQLVAKYQYNEISEEEYEKFREFEKEVYLLNTFKLVLNKLEEEGGINV